MGMIDLTSFAINSWSGSQSQTVVGTYTVFDPGATGQITITSLTLTFGFAPANASEVKISLGGTVLYDQVLGGTGTGTVYVSITINYAGAGVKGAVGDKLTFQIITANLVSGVVIGNGRVLS